MIDAYKNQQGSQRELAKRFSVSLSFIQSLLRRYRSSGSFEAKPHSGGHSAKLTNEQITSVKGSSVSIHPDEAFMQELRQRQETEFGRAKLRERSQVEHTLAHLGQWQGDRARYIGARKNLFDLHRVAVIYNLHVISRSSVAADNQQVS